MTTIPRFLMLFALTTLITAQNPAFAGTSIDSRPAAGESRLRVLTFNPEKIYNYVGFYTYTGSILFGEGEEIYTVSLGNPGAWQTMAKGRRLFLKPVALRTQDTRTNMMVVTKKHTYYFELSGEHADGPNDPDIVWEVKFVYAEDDQEQTTVMHYRSEAAEAPDMTDLSRYNFNYTVSGSEYISPLRIFDDGEFTYMEYPKVNADIPAVFVVDSEGKDATVNYHVAEQYIVVHRVTGKFTLRHGNDVACVFNEARRGRLPAAPGAGRR